ncbi:neuronal pentraxin-2-like [Ptychodera flava]|uniref:neuronal pentraxin-2-like n=1 Tax=Ptychodera flava TaxID=63121 RepID=UPI00396A5C1F
MMYGAFVHYASRYNSDELVLFDVQLLRVFMKSTSSGTDLTVNDGTWHHVCFSWSSSGGLWKIYDNGILYEDGAGLWPGWKLHGGGGTLALGHLPHSSCDSDYIYIGKLTSFNMWSSALTASQVAQVAGGCFSGGDIFTWNTTSLAMSGNVSGE